MVSIIKTGVRLAKLAKRVLCPLRGTDTSTKNPFVLLDSLWLAFAFLNHSDFSDVLRVPSGHFEIAETYLSSRSLILPCQRRESIITAERITVRPTLTATTYTMVECTMSTLVWLSVLFFQAIVQYTVRRKKHSRIATIVRRNSLVDTPSKSRTEQGTKQSHCQSNNNNMGDCNGSEAGGTVDESQTDRAFDEEDDDDFLVLNDTEDSFDGDEPKIFFQLLSQTGCEMMNVRKKSTMLSG